MLKQIEKAIRAHGLLHPGERVAVACSGGADSVALLRAMAELRAELGVVLSVAHFHHGIRGEGADQDRDFVSALARQLDLELQLGRGDAPAYARECKLSLETAARELRHNWFAELIGGGKVDKIATAHTLDDQAETVLMRVIRGTGIRGLAGIAPYHREKALIRPMLEVSRCEVEEYLGAHHQAWREDPSNQDRTHTRNRVRHDLLPVLEREFNPNVRHTLADLARLSATEADYWRQQVAASTLQLFKQGKPTRSGRASTGDAANVWSLDLERFWTLHPALQMQLLSHAGQLLGCLLEFKHIQQLLALANDKAGKKLVLPGKLVASRTFRELQFAPDAVASGEQEASDYSVRLTVPGEAEVLELGTLFRATLIHPGDLEISRYNPATLLNSALLGPEVTVRNWRAGDRYFPAHTQSPRKVKELLQPGRLGKPVSEVERRLWPVVESGGRIVWIRGFPVPGEFAYHEGTAVLIEERESNSGAKS
jgi:tRNA(Ile)-lysidine synthase